MVLTLISPVVTQRRLRLAVDAFIAIPPVFVVGSAGALDFADYPGCRALAAGSDRVCPTIGISERRDQIGMVDTTDGT